MTVDKVTDEVLQSLQDRYLPALVMLAADKVRKQGHWLVQLISSHTLVAK